MFGRQTRLLLVKRLEHRLSAQIPRHAALQQSPVPWLSHPCYRAAHTTRSAKLPSAAGGLGTRLPGRSPEHEPQISTTQLAVSL